MSGHSTFIGSPLQAVSCDLCGSGRDRTYLTLPDRIVGTSAQVYRLAQCQSCDLIYLNPRPYPWDIASYYPADYAPFSRPKLSERARTWLHQRSVKELWRHLGPPNRVLDIGCGTGELMNQIRRAGNPRVSGIEPSMKAARIARDQRGLDVRCGTLEQLHPPDQSYDTVLLSHVLEHLPSPRETMKHVARVLKPGGTVIIWVPNARSIAARWMGQYWMGWDVPRHFYAFTPGTLYRLIEMSRLMPGEIIHEKHAIEWAWGARLFLSDSLGLPAVDAAMAKLHPLTSAILTPLGVTSALLGQSGRIRMTASRPLE